MEPGRKKRSDWEGKSWNLYVWCLEDIYVSSKLALTDFLGPLFASNLAIHWQFGTFWRCHMSGPKGLWSFVSRKSDWERSEKAPLPRQLLKFAVAMLQNKPSSKNDTLWYMFNHLLHMHCKYHQISKFPTYVYLSFICLNSLLLIRWHGDPKRSGLGRSKGRYRPTSGWEIRIKHGAGLQCHNLTWRFAGLFYHPVFQHGNRKHPRYVYIYINQGFYVGKTWKTILYIKKHINGGCSLLSHDLNNHGVFRSHIVRAFLRRIFAPPFLGGEQDIFKPKNNLVGGFNPLKNMKVSWDDDIPNIWKNKQCSKPPTRKWSSTKNKIMTTTL